jgi:hypothetical protein
MAFRRALAPCLQAAVVFERMERRARLAPPSAPAAPLHGKGKQRGGAAAYAAAASRIGDEAGSDDSAAAVAAGEATAAAEEAAALRPPGGAFFVDGASAEGQRVGNLPGRGLRPSPRRRGERPQGDETGL